MSSTPKPDEIAVPQQTRSSWNEGDSAATAPAGRLDHRNVTAGTGGAAYAAPLVTSGAGGSNRVGDVDPLHQLAREAKACTDQLVADLQSKLGLTADDARSQVRSGVGLVFDNQLKQIARLSQPAARKQAVRQFHNLLQDIGSVEAQVRFHARCALTRTQPTWTAQQRERYVRREPLPDLLVELGYSDACIHRYYEQAHKTRESGAWDALVRIGFTPNGAGRYLHRLRQRRGDPLMLFDELIEIGLSPRQHPLHGRAASALVNATQEDLGRRLSTELDALLLLRSTAREVLRNGQWTDAAIRDRLRKCSRADLESIAGVRTADNFGFHPSAPPEPGAVADSNKEGADQSPEGDPATWHYC